LIGWSVSWSVSQMVSWSIGWSVDQSIGQFVNWLIMCLLCNVQQAKPSLAGSAHSKEGSCESIAAAAAEKVAPLPKEKKGFFFFLFARHNLLLFSRTLWLVNFYFVYNVNLCLKLSRVVLSSLFSYYHINALLFFCQIVVVTFIQLNIKKLTSLLLPCYTLITFLDYTHVTLGAIHLLVRVSDLYLRTLSWISGHFEAISSWLLTICSISSAYYFQPDGNE